MAITPPKERIWWNEPIEKIELIWIVIAFLWGLFMFSFMIAWHFIGQQNLNKEAYRIAPSNYEAKVEEFAKKFKVRDEKGVPVVKPPAGTDVYLLGRLWQWWPILELEKGTSYRIHISTIDWMSGGRLIAAFGVGWLKDEFDLLGVPFHERGKMADEYIAAIIELWTSESPTFEGKYVSFKDVLFAPKPAQKPHIPVWMGGDVDAVFNRIAKYGSGWIPFLTPPEKFPEKIEYITTHPDYTDKGHPFEVSFSLASLSVGEGHVHFDNPLAELTKDRQQLIDKLNWLKGLGVTCTNAPLPFVNSLDEHLDLAQWFIEEIAPLVR